MALTQELKELKLAIDSTSNEQEREELIAEFHKKLFEAYGIEY